MKQDILKVLRYERSKEKEINVYLNATVCQSTKCKIPVHFYQFLTIKPTRSTNFLKFILEMKLSFRQLFGPSSGVFHCTHCIGICHTSKQSAKLCDIYQCYVYIEKLLMMDRGLSETCKVSFQG
jgi:hypothetical protein